MNDEQRKKYTFDRKLPPDEKIKDEQLKNLKKIIIHNAKKTDELSKEISVLKKYFPKKSTEIHFWDKEKGTLHAINPRGVMRKFRDADLAESLREIIGRNIEIVIDDYENDSAIASRRFEKFAFLLVSDIFKNIDVESIRKQKNLFVILGPHRSLELNGNKQILENKNEYLDYKIIQVGDKIVICFDYIFADQAKNILTQLYSMASSYFSGINLNIFHFGKIGILNPNLGIGDICVPIAALDEMKVVKGDFRTYTIHNELKFNKKIAEIFREHIGEEIYTGTTINMVSVLKQSKSTLEHGLKAGGDFLDMEWSVMASLDHGYHSNYPNLGSINYFLVGIGSDKPLEGKTLADTEYPLDKEKSVSRAFIEIIKSL